jgi:transcriptional regulator with XRE-family HTH domain
MAPETLGRVVLAQLAENLTQQQIAAEFGVSQSQVSDYLNRKNRPNAATRERGEKSPVLRLSARLWLSPEEGGPDVAHSETSTDQAQGDQLISRGRGRVVGSGEVHSHG